MESKNVIFIETQSRIFPPSLDEASQQIIPPSNGMDDHNHITDDDFLRSLSDYTSVMEPLPAASAYHIAVGGFSDNPPVVELLERISEITGRDTLDGGTTGPLQEGTMPRGKPRMEFHRRAFSNRRSNRGRPREPP